MPFRRALALPALLTAAATAVALVGAAAGPSRAGGLASGPAAVGHSAATQASIAQLQHQLSADFAPLGSGASVGAFVVHASLGQVWAAAPTAMLAPASNEKLLTGATALLTLGTDFRYRTSVITDAPAAPVAGVLHGSLEIVASGDPTFGQAQLGALAKQVRALGITTVTGSLILVTSHFDAVRTGPGWPASYEPSESGPLSAFTVDHNMRTSAPAYLKDPDPTNVALFRTVLQNNAGVRVLGPNAYAPVRASRALASVTSAPLSTIVAETLLPSDNTDAELLLKQAGWISGRGGSTAGGAATVRATAAQLHVQLGAVSDGSGLGPYDRESAADLLRWLEAVVHTRVWPALQASLPVACTSGTLVNRLCGSATKGRAYAKTGTLPHDSSLTGYVLDARGEVVWFSFLVNGAASSDAAAAAIDRAVTHLATWNPPS